MEPIKTSKVAFFMLPFLGLGSIAFAQQGQPIGGYELLQTITLPGGLTGNDISWADSATARYYLADRGNATATPAVLPRLDIIDTENVQYLSSISLSAGANGVLSVSRSHEVWVGLSDSTIDVIDTDNGMITHVISTGGKMRADEAVYDPADHLVLIANDRDAPPFISFISTQTYSVVKTLPYDGTSAPMSTGGLEQSVWDGGLGKFYLAVPATAANPNGEIDEIDPQSKTVIRAFPTACKGPAGLVLIPNQRLMTSCGDVVDIASGKVVTTVQGVSGDEIWYNSGDQRVYFAGGTNRISVNVVDANSYALLTTLVVGQIVPAPGVSQTTHSVAADSVNNLVFVPVAGVGSGVGVQVWRNGASMTAVPNPIPVTDGAFGTATISWTAPNAQIVEIHVGSPSGALFTHNTNTGSMSTEAWITDGMTFYLQDVSTGQSLTSAYTLATLTVHLSH